MEHEIVVITPDFLKHDSVLVHTSQRHPMNCIKNTFESPLKERNCLLLWWVCSSTEEPKILLSFRRHNGDFRMATEWHFFLRQQMKGILVVESGPLRRFAEKKTVSDNHRMKSYQLYYRAHFSKHELNLNFLAQSEYKDLETINNYWNCTWNSAAPYISPV
jgi:hypothetical protein